MPAGARSRKRTRRHQGQGAWCRIAPADDAATAQAFGSTTPVTTNPHRGPLDRVSFVSGTDGLLAQVAPPASQDAQQKEKAQALLREGSALYKQADFAAALAKFEAAYAVFPSPKLQFNIGQANRELGRPVKAVTAFDWFVTDAFDASPELLAEARQSSADLKARLGRLRVDFRCQQPM